MDLYFSRKDPPFAFAVCIRVAGHYLHIEPEKVPHLIKRGAQQFERLDFWKLRQRLQQLRIARRLHRGAVQFALDHTQVFRNPQHANMNIVEAVIFGHE